MRLLPQSSGDFHGIDIEVLPPSDFVAGLMQLPVMPATEGNGELITHLHADGAGLGKAQMVRIRRLTAADKARLRGNEL